MGSPGDKQLVGDGSNWVYRAFIKPMGKFLPKKRRRPQDFALAGFFALHAIIRAVFELLQDCHALPCRSRYSV